MISIGPVKMISDWKAYMSNKVGIIVYSMLTVEYIYRHRRQIVRIVGRTY